jgi:hypothetical protein
MSAWRNALSARHARPVLTRPGNSKLIGAGVAGLAGVFALAPLATAAPSDTPASTSSDTGSSAKATAPATTKVAPKVALAAQFGVKKIRIGVQQKDGSYVPPASSTVGTEITISQVGGLVGDTPMVDHCVTAADTQIAGDAPSASFCEFGEELARARSTVSARQLRAITKPIDEGDIPAGQEYTILPGATVTITQNSVKAGYVIDPDSPVTVQPCQDPEPAPPLQERAAAAAPPTCDAEQIILEDGGLPPAASNDTARTRANTPVALPVLTNDTTEGAPVTGLTITADPKHGTAAASGTGANRTVRYTPAKNFVGTDSFTYSFTTANGTATAKATITVVAPPPTARDDFASTEEGSSVHIDVVANDSANGGGTLTGDSFTDPKHGKVVAAGRELRYTPDHGFVGTDTFTYTISTPFGTDTATVTVDVSALNTNGDNDQLADTGVPSGQLVEYSLAMLLVGAGASVAGRRRRRGRHAV